MAVLDLTRVNLRLSDTTVLSDINWRVEAAQRWVVLGPNGAGKTSLLRVSALYQHPTSGSVEVLGETLGRCDVRALRSRIAFSSPALAAQLVPTMSATEVVMTGRYAALAPWWHRYDDSDRRHAQALLERFGCASVRDHPFATLSAGERQRTLLARTLVNEPGLVLLDEPTAGLDVRGREELIADLSDVAGDSSAPPIVLVTHHLEEIPPGFTHAVAMRGGEIAACGEIGAVVTSATMSQAFDLDLEIRHQAGRFSATLAT